MRNVVAALVLVSVAVTLWWFVTRGSVATSVLAGAATGVVETMLMYPLENIKTQQQLCSGLTVRAGFGRTLRLHGMCGFYKGVVAVLLAAVPTQALRWGTFDAFCGFLGGCGDTQSVFLAGLVSGVVVAVVTGVPVDTLKVHAIHSLAVTLHVADDSSDTRPPPEPSPVPSPLVSSPVTPVPVALDMPFDADAAKYSPHPMPAQMRGWIPTITKKVTNQAIRFPLHHAVFGYLCGVAATCTLTSRPDLSFLAGVVAGVAGVIATHPIDVVKTQMQGLTGHRYKHSLDCVRTLLREEGVAIFARGAYIRTLRTSIGAGVTFMLFPVIKAALMRV